VPKIIKLAEDNPQVGLAVSLHSARDKVRDSLVPMNRKFPLEKLMEACKLYSSKTGRRVTFEVALQNNNTHQEEAQAIVKLLKGMLAESIHRPARDKIIMFKKILEAAKISVSVREEKGIDIDAACGQLRQRLECERYESVNQS